MTVSRITLSRRQRLGLGGAALLAIGAAGGAGAVSLTRPSVEMAPTVPTPIARLPGKAGVVTVRGRVAEVYGDRFVVQDASGRTLVDAGRGGEAQRAGSPIMIQGRYGDGQLHARYLVDASGTVEEVGPRHPPHGHGGPPPGGPGTPPPPPPGGPGAPPPPPPGAGAPPPPGAAPRGAADEARVAPPVAGALAPAAGQQPPADR